jgi:hypothetical protein
MSHYPSGEQHESQRTFEHDARDRFPRSFARGDALSLLGFFEPDVAEDEATRDAGDDASA